MYLCWHPWRRSSLGCRLWFYKRVRGRGPSLHLWQSLAAPQCLRVSSPTRAGSTLATHSVACCHSHSSRTQISVTHNTGKDARKLNVNFKILKQGFATLLNKLLNILYLNSTLCLNNYLLYLTNKNVKCNAKHVFNYFIRTVTSKTCY